jgi:hypothetical protein
MQKKVKFCFLYMTEKPSLRSVDYSLWRREREKNKIHRKKSVHNKKNDVCFSVMKIHWIPSDSFLINDNMMKNTVEEIV